MIHFVFIADKVAGQIMLEPIKKWELVYGYLFRAGLEGLPQVLRAIEEALREAQQFDLT